MTRAPPNRVVFPESTGLRRPRRSTGADHHRLGRLVVQALLVGLVEEAPAARDRRPEQAQQNANGIHSTSERTKRVCTEGVAPLSRLATRILSHFLPSVCPVLDIMIVSYAM